MKTKRPLKLLPIWLAISAVVIIAGIVLMCLLGFNTSPERAKSYSFEVRYDVSVEIDEAKVDKLEKLCDDTFKTVGISASERHDGDDISYDMTVITYVFDADTPADALKAAQEAITAGALADSDLSNAQIQVDYYALTNIEGLSDTAMWRGAVALTVGVLVGLIYIGFRFGVGCAVTGLCAVAHDAVFTLSLFAIARIPTYVYAPLLYAAIAAVFSLVFWLLHCMKLRDVKKDPALRSMEAAEAVNYAWEENRKKIVILAAVGVAIFAVAGGIAAAGVRLFLLPAMIPVAVAAYSSLLFAPSLHIPVKAAFDKFAQKHKPRYLGKKKAEKSAEPET